ncbi:MAG: TnsA endonuclease N-terminal domain-containing protein [Nitrospira sp.]|nr:TnsA endonuclease N-terminal domain-containing protein [Nitrospira sp.]
MGVGIIKHDDHEDDLMPEAKEILEKVRDGAPIRKVNNGGGSVIGFFPSWKSKKVLQFESLPEWLYAVCLECDPHVLEYYDQPFRIPVVKQGKRKEISSYHVPDWLVLTKSGLGLKEVKRLAKVQTDPRVTEVAEQARTWGAAKGLIYDVVTEENQPEKTELENLRFLVEFRFAPRNLASVKYALLRIVDQQPGITVFNLAKAGASTESDYRAVLPCVWHLIFTRELRIELSQQVIQAGSERTVRVNRTH